MADTLARAGLPLGLAIIAGRNHELKSRLERRSWPIPVWVYGFVRQMPEMMRAADILVTKAGPGTISEALNAGLPLILYSHLPGQEEGNITYVTDHGAGFWAPQADRVVTVIRRWLEHPAELERARQACLSLARPQAAREIARLLAEKIPLAEPDI
jgi:1,2-diacylglycerol 3-beta-galactosyltransferase